MPSAAIATGCVDFVLPLSVAFTTAYDGLR
jgi:hypothetical protein